MGILRKEIRVSIFSVHTTRNNTNVSITTLSYLKKSGQVFISAWCMVYGYFIPLAFLDNKVMIHCF